MVVFSSFLGREKIGKSSRAGGVKLVGDRMQFYLVSCSGNSLFPVKYRNEVCLKVTVENYVVYGRRWLFTSNGGSKYVRCVC